MSVSLVKAPTGRTWREIIGDVPGALRMDSEAGMAWFTGDDLPDIGATAYMGDFDRNVSKYRSADDVPYVVIPYTTWGDYAGDAVTRSNCRSLFRDYSESFVLVEGGWSSAFLVAPADATPDEFVADLILGLDNHPLIDDEDHSALTDETIDADWSVYIAHDIFDDVDTALGIGDTIDVDWTIDDVITADELREIVGAFYSDAADEYPYMESATTVILPCRDEMIAYVADRAHAFILRAYDYGAPVQRETLDIHV